MEDSTSSILFKIQLREAKLRSEPRAWWKEAHFRLRTLPIFLWCYRLLVIRWVYLFLFISWLVGSVNNVSMIQLYCRWWSSLGVATVVFLILDSMFRNDREKTIWFILYRIWADLDAHQYWSSVEAKLHLFWLASPFVVGDLVTLGLVGQSLSLVLKPLAWVLFVFALFSISFPISLLTPKNSSDYEVVLEDLEWDDYLDEEHEDLEWDDYLDEEHNDLDEEHEDYDEMWK